MKKMLSVADVKAVAPGRLRVSWDDDVTRMVDVANQLNGHVLLEMLNLPEVFRDVSVVEGGGGIQWSNGADFSARALRNWSDEQMNEPMKVSA